VTRRELLRWTVWLAGVAAAAGYTLDRGVSRSALAQNDQALRQKRILSRTPYEDFTTGWMQTGAGFQYSSAPDDSRQLLQLSSSFAVSAGARKMLQAPPAWLSELSIFVDEPTNLDRLDLEFSGNGFTTGWIDFKIPGQVIKRGWNLVRFTPYDLSQPREGPVPGPYSLGYRSGPKGFDPGTDWPNVNEIGVSAQSTPGTTVNVWLADMSALSARAAVTLTFDDARDNQYLNAYPWLAAYGWHGVVYVVTDAVDKPRFTLVGPPSTVITPISSRQLQEMQTGGWDIAAHTRTHPDLTTLSPEQQDDELRQCWQWLMDHGFASGARFFATPYGMKNDATLSIVPHYFANLRDLSASGNTGYEDHALNRIGTSSTYGLRYQEILNGDKTSFDQFKGWVDTSIQLGEWLILGSHDIGVEGGISEPLFRSYLDYLDKRRSDIDVVSMSEYWDSTPTASSAQ
jgi:peptidoglycan/xylan/chitin deacetylase (PgdA/CDA1 family)